MFQKKFSRYFVWTLAFCLGFVFKFLLNEGTSHFNFSADQEVKRSHYSSTDSQNNEGDPSEKDDLARGDQKPQQSRQPAASQSPSNKPGTIPNRILAYLEAHGTGKWKARANPKGELYRFTGGRIEGVGRSKEKLTEFVGGFAETMGIPSNQVLQKIESDELRSSKIFDALQTYEGMDVFQSWLRLMTDKRTGEAYLVNNKLKILEPDINTQVNFNRDDAYDVLTRHFGDEFKKVKRDWGPVVWADSSPHQLAFVFIVQTSKTTYRSVVGASSEKVLISEQLPMH